MRKQRHVHTKDVSGGVNSADRLIGAADVMSQAEGFLHLLDVCFSLGKKTRE